MTPVHLPRTYWCRVDLRADEVHSYGDVFRSRKLLALFEHLPTMS